MLGLGRMRSKNLKSLLLLCISETTVLAKAHQDHRAEVETAVADLIGSGQTHRALLWVELVMREQNMIDAIFMVQRILYIFAEKALQIHTHKSCPNELREAVASLIYAAPRLGECPKLHRLCTLLHSWFMKHSFTCSSEANQQLVQMLSTRQPSLERRLETMKEISAANGITLDLKKNSISEFD